MKNLKSINNRFEVTITLTVENSSVLGNLILNNAFVLPKNSIQNFVSFLKENQVSYSISDFDENRKLIETKMFASNAGKLFSLLGFCSYQEIPYSYEVNHNRFKKGSRLYNRDLNYWVFNLKTKESKLMPSTPFKVGYKPTRGTGSNSHFIAKRIK